MGKRRWGAVAAALLVVGAVTGGTMGSSAAAALGRSLPPGPVYGVTIDDVSNISQVVASEAALPVMPTTRVYLDPAEPASYYTSPLSQLDPHSYVLGELLDSSDMTAVTPTSEHKRVTNLLSKLGPYVDIWEVGNEVNGNWTGSYSTGAQMVTDAYNQVTAAGGTSALTLYYNVGCGDGPSELDPITYAQKYLSSTVRAGLGYVLLSYYQTQCNNIVLDASTVTSYEQQLHTLFPHALLGFGEVGLPDPVTTATTPTAVSIIDHYYPLAVSLPYYIGGYFYWYYDEDAVPYQGNPIWSALSASMPLESYQATSSTTTTLAPAALTPFSSMPASSWSEGATYSGWTDQWNGYGTAAITWDSTRTANVLSVSPAAPLTSSETHSALITSASTLSSPAFTVPLDTVTQLRQGSPPNPWEVGWVLWDYTGSSSFYDVVLKPNGWELDREDPAYPGGQHFLASGATPVFPIGRWYSVSVSQSKAVITVSVNGVPLVSTSDPTSSGPLTGGAIGLYSEDATVHFGDVAVG